MKRTNNLLKALTCGVAALAFTACTDTWDNHYEPKPELNATETLWDIIEADPELSNFAAYAKATGYDVLLSQNRFYTIWAPVNDAEFYQGKDLTNANDSLLETYKFEFVENHIADYNHTASGNMVENKVKMLNGKYNPFIGSTGNYTFKDVAVKETNIAAKNGLLHKINNNAVFTANIWEQLAMVPGDSITLLNEYFKSFDKMEFDEVNSVEGSMVGGQVTYLDSVIIEHNDWFDRIGLLNREDSSYIMYAPTNKAWRETYEKAKTYFVYDKTNIDGDSLQEAMAKDFMVRHLVFSQTIQRSPEDSLVSRCYSALSGSGYGRWETEVFKGEDLERLDANLVKTYNLSNGELRIVDSYNYKTLWHDTLRVLGNSLFGAGEGVDPGEYTQAVKESLNVPKDSTKWYRQTYNGSIGVYKPSTPSGNPTLTYTFNNVLSAKYRVRVVFVPNNFVNPRDTALMPNKFNATLKYRDASGKSKSLQLVKDYIYTPNPTKTDTLTLVSSKAEEGVDYFEFPVNEFNLNTSEKSMTQLEIKGRVGSRETGFDRVLRIDQVYLEPVTE